MTKFVLFTLFAIISTAWAYSAGAPESTCDDMTPKHPVSPQSTKLPYTISVSKKEIKAGEEITITISGKTFKGFLLQVRNKDKAVGSFNVSDSDKYVKGINCHGGTKSGATHKNASEKKDLVLKWKAPDATGEYVVYATVAEDGGTFWAAQKTQIIKVK